MSEVPFAVTSNFRLESMLCGHNISSLKELFGLRIILNISLSIHGQILCDDVNNEQNCTNIRESGQNCYFNLTNNRCITFNCGTLRNEDQCQSFDKQYQCSWAIVDLINDNFCYTQCDKELDIVFIVDTTASIIETNPNNSITYGNFVQYLMQSWYFLNTEYQNVSTYFSLITFGTFVQTQFDLNSKYVLHCASYLSHNFDYLFISVIHWANI